MKTLIQIAPICNPQSAYNVGIHAHNTYTCIQVKTFFSQYINVTIAA
uniref:Uncharacterized protein n=1 Tax=Anas platyrhynchos platyrhynchos TaxID=8840 RepID=A0A493TLS5_ANAPP